MAADWTRLPGYGVLFLAITIVVAFIAVICFAGRTYTGLVYTKRFRLDYWLLLSTLIICAVSQAAFWVAVTYGLGAHEEDLDPSDIVVALRAAWINQIPGLIAIVTGKFAIIVFLDQIRGHHRGRPWFLYFVGGSILVVNAVVIVLACIQCIPIQKLWDEQVPGHCSLRPLNQTYAYFQGSHSAVTDVILALYPIHLIWGVLLSKRLRIGLSCLMGFGLLAAVCSTIKTIELRNLTMTKDKTFYISLLAFTTMLEAWIVLIVGCIPSLRPLMKAVAKRLWGTPFTKQTYQIYDYQHDKYGKFSKAARFDGADHSFPGGQAHVPCNFKVGTVELCEIRKEGSQDSIDNEASFSGGGTIIKTTDISVWYDSTSVDEV